MSDSKSKLEKMTMLEERLYENTILKKNKKTPSEKELNELQDKFDASLTIKKDGIQKRKNRILQRLEIEKAGLDGINPEIEDNDVVKTPDDRYEMVNHPKHYNNYDVEVVDMMEKIWGTKATMEWCKMTAYKYRMRMGTKPAEEDTKEAMKSKLMEDFEKEQWYLDKAAKLKSKLLDKSIDMNN